MLLLVVVFYNWDVGASGYIYVDGSASDTQHPYRDLIAQCSR